MTRKSYVAAIACVLLCISVLAPANTQAQRVVLEWKIDQQKLLSGELYQTAFLLEEKAVVGMTREKIVRIDRDGDVSTLIDLLPGQRANLSIDGGLVCVMSSTRDLIDRFELKTLDGKTVVEIEPRGTFVSFLAGRGAVMIIGVEAEKPPTAFNVPYTYHLYDRRGREIKLLKSVNPLGTALAPDGKAFVINDPQSGVMAISPKGSMLWRVEDPYRSFAVSNGATRMVGNSSSKIEQIALYLNGALIGRSSLRLPVCNIAISPRGAYTVATDARTIRLYADKLKKKWNYTFKDESLTINSVAVCDNELVACGVIKDNGQDMPLEKRYTQGLAALFSKRGKVLWREEYALGRANAWIPKVALYEIDEEMTAMTVQTREHLLLYTIQ